jgi:hypothetical protein
LFKLRLTLLWFIAGVLFVLITHTVNAQSLQELEITLSESDGGYAVFADYPDKSAIIFRSDLTNLIFGSNLEINANLSEPEKGIYRIIIPPFIQMISINATGYRQEKIRVQPSGARDVIYYDVSVKNRVNDLVPVNFIVQDDGENVNQNISIFIDDQVIESESNTYLLTPGEKVIRIDGGRRFRPIIDTLQISPMNTYFPYSLEELDVEELSIRTNPTNATIQIEGENPRQTPYSQFKYPGTYYIQINREGYKKYEDQITVESGGNNVFDFDLVESNTRLSMFVQPEGATVLLNRENISSSSNRYSIPLSPGIYRLEVSKEGYDTKVEQFEVVEEQEVVKEIELVQHIGSLRFEVYPIDALVSLADQNGDRIDQWRGLNRLQLPVGKYFLSSELVNHNSIQDEFTILRDSVTVINLEHIQTVGTGRLDINGLEDSQITVKGAREYTFNSLPITLPSLPYGEYDIIIKKNGFRDIKETIDFRRTNLNVDMFSYYEPKQKSSGIMRSLVIPGWGHHYLDQNRSRRYFIGGLALLGTGIFVQQNYKNKSKQYDQALFTYLNSRGNFDENYQQVLNRLDDQNSAVNIRNAVVGTLIGFKLIEFIDLMLFTKDPAKAFENEQKNLLFNFNSNGLAMRVNF